MLCTRDSFVAVWQSMLMMKSTTEDAVKTLVTTSTHGAHDWRMLHQDHTQTFTIISYAGSKPGERLLKYTDSVTINAPDPKSTSLPNNALAVST